MSLASSTFFGLNKQSQNQFGSINFQNKQNSQICQQGMQQQKITKSILKSQNIPIQNENLQSKVEQSSLFYSKYSKAQNNNNTNISNQNAQQYLKTIDNLVSQHQKQQTLQQIPYQNIGISHFSYHPQRQIQATSKNSDIRVYLESLQNKFQKKKKISVSDSITEESSSEKSSKIKKQKKQLKMKKSTKNEKKIHSLNQITKNEKKANVIKKSNASQVSGTLKQTNLIANTHSSKQQQINLVFCIICEDYIQLDKVDEHSKFCQQNQLLLQSRKKFDENTDSELIYQLEKLNQKMRKIKIHVEEKSIENNKKLQSLVEIVQECCQSIINNNKNYTEIVDNLRDLDLIYKRIFQLENQSNKQIIYTFLILTDKMKEFTKNKIQIMRSNSLLISQMNYSQQNNNNNSQSFSNLNSNKQQFLSINSLEFNTNNKEPTTCNQDKTLSGKANNPGKENKSQVIQTLNDIICFEFPNFMNKKNTITNQISNIQANNPKEKQEFMQTFLKVKSSLNLNDKQKQILIGDLYESFLESKENNKEKFITEYFNKLQQI